MTLTAAGAAGLLAAVGAELNLLHWPGHTSDLLSGAHCLVSSAICPNQTLGRGPKLLGLQFLGGMHGNPVKRGPVGRLEEISDTPAACVAVTARRHRAASY